MSIGVLITYKCSHHKATTATELLSKTFGALQNIMLIAWYSSHFVLGPSPLSAFIPQQQIFIFPLSLGTLKKRRWG